MSKRKPYHSSPPDYSSEGVLGGGELPADVAFGSSSPVKLDKIQLERLAWFAKEVGDTAKDVLSVAVESYLAVQCDRAKKRARDDDDVNLKLSKRFHQLETVTAKLQVKEAWMFRVGVALLLELLEKRTDDGQKTLFEALFADPRGSVVDCVIAAVREWLS